MKDRWKITLIFLSFIFIIGLIFMFLAISFHRVQLREYGLKYNSYWGTIDSSQTVRENGNYIIGLDHNFLKFSAGLISYQIKINALTRDRSEIQVSGLFIGKLIKGYAIQMYFQYGPLYQQFLQASIQQFFRESIEQFSLNQLISNRKNVNSYISSELEVNIEQLYTWINVELVSLGEVAGNIPPPTIIKQDFPIQKIYINALEDNINIQKKKNIFQSGGYELVKKIEDANAQLFLNATTQIIQKTKLAPNQQQKIYATGYILNGISKTLNKNITFKIISQ